MPNDYRQRQALLSQEYNQADAICISYPKCGRTWVRHVLGHYFHKLYGVENTHRLNSLKENIGVRKKANCPLVSFTHDNHSFASEISNDEFGRLEIDKFIFQEIYENKTYYVKYLHMFHDSDSACYFEQMLKTNKIYGVFFLTRRGNQSVDDL